jgi:lipoprotein signal peptidase
MATHDAGPTTYNRFLIIMVPVLLMGVLADQATKFWATVRAVEPHILVPGYVVAYSVPNNGTILGVGHDRAWTSMVTALAGVVCAAWLTRLALRDWQRWGRPDCLAVALLFAGIFGNTLDRLALGYVRDFLVTWAIPNYVFNVADLLVVVGCASLLITRYCSVRGSQPALRFPAAAATC